MKRLWQVRELSTVAILVLEVLFFTWWLWPDANRSHPFLNASNGLLILKYSAIYGIAAVSKPPTMRRDGFLRSHASVIGQNVCQDANQPTTTSAPRTACSTAKGFATRPGCAHSRTSQRSRSRAVSPKL